MVINIIGLIWNEWNIIHIARHDITQVEVEEVCQNNPVIEQGKKGRLLIIGFTFTSRAITAILDPEDQEGIYYPVTARPASRRERKIYEYKKSGGEN